MKIKLLTPIWTGDIENCSQELKLTGLIGSLRWWFSVLANDEANKKIICDGNSIFDYQKYQEILEKTIKNKKICFDSKIEAQLQALDCRCPACLLFGTTGLQRKFILRVKNLKAKKLIIPEKFKLPEKFHYKVTVENEEKTIKCVNCNKMIEWTMEKKNLLNNEDSSIMALYPEAGDYFELNFDVYDLDFKDYIESIFIYLFSKISGKAIGAKNQNGFGYIEFDADSKKLKEGKKNFELLINLAKKVRSQKKNDSKEIKYVSFPDYKKHFEILYTLEDDIPYQIVFNNNKNSVKSVEDKVKKEKISFLSAIFLRQILRNQLRRNLKIEEINELYIKKGEDENLREVAVNMLFGNSDDEDKLRSPIQISNLYYNPKIKKWQFKVWGWFNTPVSSEHEIKFNESKVKNFIDKQLKSFFNNKLSSNIDKEGARKND